MTRIPPGGFERELERRLAILVQDREADRRLPGADSIALASTTVASFAIVLIAQGF